MNVTKLLRVLHDAEALATIIKNTARDFAQDDTLADAVKDEKLRTDLAAAKAAAEKLASDLAS